MVVQSRTAADLRAQVIRRLHPWPGEMIAALDALEVVMAGEAALRPAARAALLRCWRARDAGLDPVVQRAVDGLEEL